jgi:hypothetical protein
VVEAAGAQAASSENTKRAAMKIFPGANFLETMFFLLNRERN